MNTQSQGISKGSVVTQAISMPVWLAESIRLAFRKKNVSELIELNRDWYRTVENLLWKWPNDKNI